MEENARDGASLIVVAVPPAARSLAPRPKAGSSCRDCASSPLLLPRAGHTGPGASNRKARDYEDRPPGCQREARVQQILGLADRTETYIRWYRVSQVPLS